MKRQHFLTLLLASFFVIMAFHGGHVYAQNSIAGDSVCGRWDPTLNGGKGAIVNPCGVTSVKTISQGIFKLIIGLGLPLLVVMIIYRFVMAWYSLQQGNTNAYKEAGKKATEGIIGFLIIVALFGGITLAMLKYFGVKDGTGGVFNPLKLLQSISLIEIPHAYAATSLCAPPKKGDTCYFTANGGARSGTITDADSFFDKSLFCKDLNGLTSNTDFVNSTKYWRGSTDCTGKANGTVCDLGSAYYNAMGICSSSYVSATQTGPAECLGKVDKTFCKARPNSSLAGSAGVCTLRGTTFTCDLASTGDICFSPTTQRQGTISNINGFCGVVGDPCVTSSGAQGVYSSAYVCIIPAISTTPPASASVSTDVTTNAAQLSAPLPNPLGFDSLYDFILGALNTVMKFFLYPAMIGVWVWSGFLYVAAQGAPDKLKKAHNLLLWAFITTLIVFTTQGFLTAMKGSVNKIIPNSVTTTSVTNTTQNATDAVDTNTIVSPVGTVDGRVPPKDNTYGAVCTMTDGSGRMGTLGADNVTCYPGRGGGTLPTSNTSASVPQAQVLTPGAQANTTTICSSLSSASQQMSCFRGKVCDLIISQSEQAFCLAVKAQVDPAIYASQTCGLIVSESDRETCRIVQLKAKSTQ